MNDTAKRFLPSRLDFATFKAKHFLWEVDGKVATVTLNRPERKNPLTLDSYAELRDTFRDLVYSDAIKTVVIPAPAAISAPAATCTKSSARWSRCSARTTWPACSPSRA